MAMVYRSLFAPNFTFIPSIKPTTSPLSVGPCFPSIKRRDFPLPEVASVTYPPIDVDYLEREFRGHGVTFDDISGSCVVRMGLDNGSLATLMLPSGLITSYKAPMWHGGTLELLHTSVSEGESGEAVIQGGVSLALKCQSDDDDEASWSPHTWALCDVRGSPRESIQVELVSCNSLDMVEVKHVLTLQQDLLSSDLVISSSKSSSLHLTGSIISHLTVSTPEATYAVGLEGSDFYSRPPFLTNFSIIPPEPRQEKDSRSRKLWGLGAVNDLFSTWVANETKSRTKERDEEMEGEEEDNIKHLADKMSRIYTSAPQYFTVIDRGKRNSVVVGREGFDELYVFSPGSSHRWYGKYAYVCVGQSALLKPIILGPEGEWRGSQQLHNPNM